MQNVFDYINVNNRNYIHGSVGEVLIKKLACNLLSKSFQISGKLLLYDVDVYPSSIRSDRKDDSKKLVLSVFRKQRNKMIFSSFRITSMLHLLRNRLFCLLLNPFIMLLCTQRKESFLDCCGKGVRTKPGKP